jgi:hypothetical protein
MDPAPVELNVGKYINRDHDRIERLDRFEEEGRGVAFAKDLAA